MPTLAQRLAEASHLLADGAMATNLFEMGLTPGHAPELWLDSHPDRIAALHRRFVDAGADIILTNSFGGTARRLRLHQLQTHAHALNQRAAEIAREAADACSRPVIVAGSVGPTGDPFTPLGQLTEADAVGVFAEQIEGLKAGGADVIWIETMSAVEEMRAAAAAAAAVGMPYTLTASFDTAACTLTGLTPAAFAAFVATLGAQPLAIGANCGVGAADLVCSVLGMTDAGPIEIDPPMPVIAKANAGLPVLQGEHWHYAATPHVMADYVTLAAHAGARIIGGCCGTTPAHLAAMRRALDNLQDGPRPDLDTVTARLGTRVSPPKPNPGNLPDGSGRQ